MFRRTIPLNRIGHFTAMQLIGFQGILKFMVAGIRETVPAPLGLCSQGHAFRIGIGEGLQTGYVNGERKRSISDRQR